MELQFSPRRLCATMQKTTAGRTQNSKVLAGSIYSSATGGRDAELFPNFSVKRLWPDRAVEMNQGAADWDGADQREARGGCGRKTLFHARFKKTLVNFRQRGRIMFGRQMVFRWLQS